MKKLKVLIADDSVVYRSQIKAALSDISQFEIVRAVANGKIAIELLLKEQIDLLILDLEMPELDGVQTLTEMNKRGISCKTLVFSSISKAGAAITLEALKLGASDFITKPGVLDATPSESLGFNPTVRIKNVLVPKIFGLFPDVQTGVSETAKPLGVENKKYPSLIWDLLKPEIVLIGSSTGGPTVLENIFSQLAPPLKCPVLITQHMPPVFTTALAERLTKMSGIQVREAVHGERLQSQCVYLAPGNFHMSLIGTKSRCQIVLSQEESIHFVRPAVDPLFLSAASIFKDKCFGIVLTGMGSDGKLGAEEIKKVGGAICIQSKESCVVFGMPGAVYSSGAYDKMLSPNSIADELRRFAAEKGTALEKKIVKQG